MPTILLVEDNANNAEDIVRKMDLSVATHDDDFSDFLKELHTRARLWK